MSKSSLPFDILETHVCADGIVLHIHSVLTDVETYVTYPGATKEDLESRKIFSHSRWSATFSPDRVGRHLALSLLKMYGEITQGIELRRAGGIEDPEGFLMDSFNDPKQN